MKILILLYIKINNFLKYLNFFWFFIKKINFLYKKLFFINTNIHQCFKNSVGILNFNDNKDVGEKMKIFLYIDESGSIHVNSKTRYFAVGGYFVLEKDKGKVISLYKQINLSINRNRKIDLKKELKSYDLLDSEKI